MKPTPKVIASAGLATVILTSTALAAERSYDFSGFNAVEASSGLTVEIEVGPEFAVSAEARRDRHLDRLEIERKGETLVVSRKTSWSGLSWFSSSPNITVSIEMPALRAAEMTSGSTGVLTGNLDEALDLSISSGSTVSAAGIDQVPVSLTASSGASGKLEGACSLLNLRVSSGASVNAKRLECTDVTARISSGSSASAFASNSVEARASSGASLTVYGDPAARDAESSSGASLSFR